MNAYILAKDPAQLSLRGFMKAEAISLTTNNY